MVSFRSHIKGLLHEGLGGLRRAVSRAVTPSDWRRRTSGGEQGFWGGLRGWELDRWETCLLQGGRGRERRQGKGPRLQEAVDGEGQAKEGAPSPGGWREGASPELRPGGAAVRAWCVPSRRCRVGSWTWKSEAPERQ